MDRILLQEYKEVYNQYLKVADLLNKDFQFYLKINEKTSQYLLDPNKDKQQFLNNIKIEVFDEKICQEKNLEEIKNSFLRNYFEIEKIKKETDFLGLFNNISIVYQTISKLIQKHWELYQYKKETVNLDDIFDIFINRLEKIISLWDSFTNKFEVLTRLFVASQYRITYHEPTKKILNIYFNRNQTRGVNLETFENFLALVKVVEELIQGLVGNSKSVLEVNSAQVYFNSFYLKLFLDSENAIFFENIITALRVDILKQDGLQKLLSKFFEAEKLRALDKKVILKYQKKLKELINKIKRAGDFKIDKNSEQELILKLVSFLEKIDKLEYNSLSRKNALRYNLFPKVNNFETESKVTVSPLKINSEKKEHLGYLSG